MLYNPTIFESRTVLMQRIADAVSNGYTHYCSGSVSPGRCARLVRKFDLAYTVSADRNERARRKRAGMGNATLLLWSYDGVVYWWLMVTPINRGEHPAHAIESLRDANRLDGRIELDSFELVTLTKKAYKNAPAATRTRRPVVDKSTVLTWRMKDVKYQGWRDSIIESIRHGNTRSIELLIYRLWSSPGFSGVRTQVGKVAALYRNEVKRSGRTDVPALPKRLGYVRRLSNQGISLNVLVAQARMHATTDTTSAAA